MATIIGLLMIYSFIINGMILSEINILLSPIPFVLFVLLVIYQKKQIKINAREKFGFEQKENTDINSFIYKLLSLINIIMIFSSLFFSIELFL